MDMKKLRPDRIAKLIFSSLYDLHKKYIPRFIKNEFIKSGNARVEKIISVGKSANKNAAINDMISFSVIKFASLKTRNKFSIENKNGKVIVDVWLIPNNKNESVINKV